MTNRAGAQIPKYRYSRSGYSGNAPRRHSALANTPKECRVRSRILWDFVGSSQLNACFNVTSISNRCAFSQLLCPRSNLTTWHLVCSQYRNIQDWLPGVAGTDPRLGYRFWGVNYEKGACTSPLFHFRRPLGGRPRNDRFTVANETTNRGSG